MTTNEAFSRSHEEEYAYLSEKSVSNGFDKSNSVCNDD